MEFEPEMIETISEMLGARINSKNVKEEKDEEEEETTSQAKTAQTKFLIRPGREQDVVTDSREEKKSSVKIGSGCTNEDYTYEDYEREFLAERSEAEVYADDGRRVAEYQILQARRSENRSKWKTVLIIIGALHMVSFYFCCRKAAI
jgi:hypothetical protein